MRKARTARSRSAKRTKEASGSFEPLSFDNIQWTDANVSSRMLSVGVMLIESFSIPYSTENHWESDADWG